MSRKIVTITTVFIWIGILVAGLWPFNFVPRNGIRWLPAGAGLRFDDYGQVYSSKPMSFPRGKHGNAEATIELIFTPAVPYENAGSTVFALVHQDEVSFAIGQSLTNLFIQGFFTRGGDKSVAKLWIDKVCSRAQELFVTVSLDSHLVDVYLDGQVAGSFPVTTPADSLSGEILVGHSVKGNGHWSGSVARLAIFEGVLDAAEISRRYEQWRKTRHLDMDVRHEGAVYEFVMPVKDFVSNVGEIGPDLVIPEIFRVLKPTVLEWPDHFDLSVAVDAIVNIVGFVPLGLGTCLCLRFWSEWSVARCVVITIVAGAFVSLGIELLQVLLPTRDSSLADLVMNILGTVLGASAGVISK